MKYDTKIPQEWVDKRSAKLSEFDLLYAHGQGYEEGTLAWCKEYIGKGLWGNKLGEYYVIHNGRKVIAESTNLKWVVEVFNSLE